MVDRSSADVSPSQLSGQQRSPLEQVSVLDWMWVERLKQVLSISVVHWLSRGAQIRVCDDSCLQILRQSFQSTAETKVVDYDDEGDD